jgi:hypothetical protein
MRSTRVRAVRLIDGAHTPRPALVWRLALSVTVLLAGCSASDGPERSAAAFCRTYDELRAQFAADYDTSNLPPMQALATGVASVGELPVIFERLDRVAPPEIEPDVAATRDALKQQIQALTGADLTNPIGVMLSGVLSGLFASGPIQRVGGYVKVNCGAANAGPSVASTAVSTLLSFGGSVTMVDPDGYEYGVTFDSSYGAPTKSIQFDSPGSASVLLPVRGTIQITNNTQGREAPAPPPELAIVALFDGGGVICHSGLAITWNDQYCGLRIASASTSAATLGIGALTTASFGPLQSLNDRSAGYSQDSSVLHGSESDVEQILSSLTAGPANFALLAKTGTDFFLGTIVFGPPGGAGCQLSVGDVLGTATFSVIAVGTGAGGAQPASTC